MTSENFNVGRALTDGRINRPDIASPKRAGTPPTLSEAIVYEIFADPASLTRQQKDELKAQVSNPEHVEWISANSVMAKVVSSGQNQTDDAPVLLFPFFQSHIMLPIQVGEKVFVIYDDYVFKGSSMGRWITRPTEPHTVEDVNFTHSDRKLDPINNPATLELAAINRRNINGQTAQINNERPNFPNGAGYDSATTLVQYRSSQSDTRNPFDVIYKESKSSKAHTYEPVPVWTKRPQEFVLQGMNNATIVLGQDRIGPLVREESTTEKKKYAGTIDIVSGRGRFPLSVNDVNAPATKKTSTLVVQNSRGDLERDKTPFVRSRQKNQKEGDPDFQTDAARVYVSMNSEADTNFKIKDGAGITYPEKTLKITQPPAVSEDVGTSYVVAKADNIRLIARKSENPSIKGTFAIVKEGTKDVDLAYIFITKDGRVQIEGPQIFLGKATNGGQEPAFNSPEAGEQPYIKYQQYKATVEHLQSQIDTLKTYLTTVVTAIGGAMAASVAVPFSPVASLVAAAPGLTSATQQMQATISQNSAQTPTKITDCRSKKIFGE